MQRSQLPALNNSQLAVVRCQTELVSRARVRRAKILPSHACRRGCYCDRDAFIFSPFGGRSITSRREQVRTQLQKLLLDRVVRAEARVPPAWANASPAAAWCVRSTRVDEKSACVNQLFRAATQTLKCAAQRSRVEVRRRFRRQRVVQRRLAAVVRASGLTELGQKPATHCFRTQMKATLGYELVATLFEAVVQRELLLNHSFTICAGCLVSKNLDGYSINVNFLLKMALRNFIDNNFWFNFELGWKFSHFDLIIKYLFNTKWLVHSRKIALSDFSVKNNDIAFSVIFCDTGMLA